MEFPGISVGGGFAGTAGESSSFRYGFFDRTINWIEMVLANGEIVKASSTSKSDLFYGAASSFGTLGVIAEAQVEIEKATEDTSTHYLDGIMYSKDNGVICVGRLTNDVPADTPVQGFTRPTDP
ncbi:uncharacterized protein RSE6_07029 [Rhynchosporium secalis]|uniref:FAD-binding PCMH-type domain-containing protein n=1 Tax=Rhynchosporium secalis TaxID=38038 RepID=A0A1E1MBU3_RHYSE|nr:uncharacterized protein RSE6_07029 [Rhynchosporium secalis]